MVDVSCKQLSVHKNIMKFTSISLFLLLILNFNVPVQLKGTNSLFNPNERFYYMGIELLENILSSKCEVYLNIVCFAFKSGVKLRFR